MTNLTEDQIKEIESISDEEWERQRAADLQRATEFFDKLNEGCFPGKIVELQTMENKDWTQPHAIAYRRKHSSDTYDCVHFEFGTVVTLREYTNYFDVWECDTPEGILYIPARFFKKNA